MMHAHMYTHILYSHNACIHIYTYCTTYAHTSTHTHPHTLTTLTTFSDNGAWTEQGLDGGSNGLLRGQKGETWEGGMR